MWLMFTPLILEPLAKERRGWTRSVRTLLPHNLLHWEDRPAGWDTVLHEKAREPALPSPLGDPLVPRDSLPCR